MSSPNYRLSSADAVEFFRSDVIVEHFSNIYTGKLSSLWNKLLLEMSSERTKDILWQTRIQRMTFLEFIPHNFPQTMWNIFHGLSRILDSQEVTIMPYYIGKYEYIVLVLLPEGIIQYLVQKYDLSWIEANTVYMSEQKKVRLKVHLISIFFDFSII